MVRRYAFLPALIGLVTGQDEKCWSGPTSRYNGKQATTKSGFTCQKWLSDVPHKPKHRPKDATTENDHNHCRNPDLDLAGPWCYTTDPEKRWEYCEIDHCATDDSFVIFTNFDADQKSSHLVRVHANPEIVRSHTDDGGSFNVQTISMTNTNETMTEYWALAADYRNKQIYWTDYRAEKIGKYDWEQNKTTSNLFQGMAHGIENLAVDYVTGNLYWTDSDYKWIMVANKDCEYYTQVYKANDDPDGPPYGLALDSKNQYLFWSTYKIMGATIKRADLTANDNGGGAEIKTIVKFPIIHDVTGLTVDYLDEKLYWTDFLGSAAVVSSSTYDGSHIITHFHRTGAVFWGVASYDHYLYISDIYPKFMTEGKKYMMWVVTKKYITDPDKVGGDEPQYIPEELLGDPANEQKNFRYSINGRPRGVAVYSKFAAPETSNAVCNMDSNNRQGGCEHICIPKGSNRQCKCSLGYSLAKPQMTDCYPDIEKPPYLIFADVDHGMMFQMSLKSPQTDLEKIKYNVIPTQGGEKVHALCINPSSQDVYYSSKNKATIFKTHPSNQKEEHPVIHRGVVAQSCVVDNEGSNIFFVEGEARNIQVVSTDPENTAVKTIIEFDEEEQKKVNIQNVALDVFRRRIYWTDPTMTEGEGRIESANLDGTDRKVILKKLHWPQGIKIYNSKTKTSEGGDDDNFLIFTEALSGIIYEIDLSYLDKIPTGGLASDSLMANDHVTLYNITEASSKTQRFHMDLTYYDDYIYFNDLKETYIERFNRAEAKKNMKEKPEEAAVKPEKYGSSDFYSLVYMHAIPEDPVDLTQVYGNGCHERCEGKDELCLPKLNDQKVSQGVCVCTNGAIRGSNGECVETEINKELVIDNCPSDALLSPGMCSSMFDFELTPIRLSLDGKSLPDSSFTIAKTLKTITSNSAAPSKDISKETSVQLPDGVHMVTYTVEASDGYGELSNRKYTCSQTVTIISHKCKPLVIDEVDMLKTIAKDVEIKSRNVCLSKQDNVPTYGDAPIFGTSTSVVCKEGKNFQAYVGSKTLDEHMKSKGITPSMKWPVSSLNYTCKSLSIDLTPPGALVNIYDGQKVTLKCIDEDAATQQNNDSNFVKIDANSGEVVTAAPEPATTKSATSEGQDNSDTASDSSESGSDDVVETANAKGSNKGGVAVVVIIVLIVIAVVTFVLYKRCRSDYEGGNSFRTMFTRTPDPTAEMEVPKTSTPYAAM